MELMYEQTKLGIKMINVKSSNIAAVGWDEDHLFIQYNSGNIYMYDGVKKDKYNQLIQAESKGKFVNAYIKPTYPYQKLTHCFNKNNELVSIL